MLGVAEMITTEISFSWLHIVIVVARVERGGRMFNVFMKLMGFWRVLLCRHLLNDASNLGCSIGQCNTAQSVG